MSRSVQPSSGTAHRRRAPVYRRFVFVASLIFALVEQLCAQRVLEGSRATVEHLGQPCRGRNILAGLLVRDKGREWFVVSNTNEASGLELIFVDPLANTAKVYRAPAGSGAWALKSVAGNRLALGTYYDGTFLLFDVATRKWIKSAPVADEKYIWTLAQGNDGRIYGGSFPGGKLAAFDPLNLEAEDLGAPSEGNLYLRYTTALPDGRILCRFSFGRPETLIFDPRTTEFTPAPAPLASATSGVAWNGYFVAGQKAYGSPALTEVSPSPFPLPPREGGKWSVDVSLSDERTLILRQGGVFWRFLAGDRRLIKLADTPLPEETQLYAVNRRGDLFGVVGQDYVVLRRGAKKPDRRRIPGRAEPRPMHFLHVDAQERVWGGPPIGQTLFYHDPKSGRIVNTAAISDIRGEAYDVEVLDGTCYAATYAGGEIIRYDPREPWNPVNGRNPRRIARVGPEFIRPSAGIALGPDGRLWSGWMAKYGVYGGALAATDPQSGATELIVNPLGPAGISALAVAGDVILVGSTMRGDGLPYQPDSLGARFAVLDAKTREPRFSHTFEGVREITSIGYDAVTGSAILLVEGKLWRFHPAKADPPIAMPLERKLTTRAVTINEGRVLYGSGRFLCELDLHTGGSSVTAELPGKIDHVATRSKATVFVSCGTDLYRISVPPASAARD